MADHSYTNRGINTAHGKGRFGARFQSWDAVYSGGVLKDDAADGWSKGEVRRDHVCRPVVVGADGGAVPGVVVAPPLQYQKQNDGFPNRGEDHTVGSYYRRDQTGAEFIETIQNPASGERRMGFPGGMFQRKKAGQNRYGSFLGRATNDMGSAVDTDRALELGSTHFARKVFDLGHRSHGQ